MAQHPVKTNASGPPDKLLALTDYVDPFGNLWVTGTVVISGTSPGTVISVTPSGPFPVQVTGTSATNISQVGGQPLSEGQKPSAQSIPVVVASDQSPLNMALPSLAANTAPLNSTSTAYETSRVAKASAGVCFGLSGYNSKTSSQFILLLDATQLPANATVPVVIANVSAASNFSIDFGHWGRRFNAGIVAANSSTGPTLTLGSADCWFDVRYV